MEPIINFDTMNNVSHEGLAQFDNVVNSATEACTTTSLVDEFPMDFTMDWPLRPPEQWQPQEVSDWIRTWAQHNGVQDIDVAHLLYNPMAGFELCQLRRDYFTSVCPQYGNMIFDSLQVLINQFRSNNMMSQDFNFPAIPNFDLLSGNICLDLDTQVGHSPSSSSESDRESTSSNLSGVNERKPVVNSYFPAILTTNSSNVSNLMPETRALLDQKPVISNTTAIPAAIKKAGRRGRPPKKDAKSRSKGNGKLWEFIRDLLLNSVTNPSLIRWERREDGIFKFVQSDKVAKMWGERKQNPRMTYEKLSRAMRYYYKSQVLLPVFGRRLVYKFGPNATGWRPQYDHISMKAANGLLN